MNFRPLINIKPFSVPSNICKQKTAEVFKSLADFDNCATRLSIGVGALAVEPFIDYYSNRNLSKEDRKYSVVKTCSKIVIGTATGVAARFLGQKQGRAYLINLIDNKIKPLVKEACKTEEFKKAVNALTGQKSEAIPDIVKKTINKIQKETIFIHEKVAKDIIRDIATGAKEVPIEKGNNPKTMIESGKKLAEAFGDSVGVATAALFCLTLDIPLMNGAMNKIMSIICPEALAKHQQKGGH